VVDGGAGQCCSTCTAAEGCAGWALTPDGKTCQLFNAAGVAGARDGVSGKTGAPSVPAAGVIAGAIGNATSRAWVTLPQHFKRSGYLTLSSGKIFHSEEGGSGPPPWDGTGTGMPPLQDPPSWSQVKGPEPPVHCVLTLQAIARELRSGGVGNKCRYWCWCWCSW